MIVVGSVVLVVDVVAVDAVGVAVADEIVDNEPVGVGIAADNRIADVG